MENRPKQSTDQININTQKKCPKEEDKKKVKKNDDTSFNKNSRNTKNEQKNLEYFSEKSSQKLVKNNLQRSKNLEELQFLLSEKPIQIVYGELELRPHVIPKKMFCQSELFAASKPSVSYTQIIIEAISAHNNIAMLQQIYQYFENKYPYYRNTQKGNWKGSIRHNLSLCKIFKRVPKEGKKGKGGYWSFDEEYLKNRKEKKEEND